MDGSEQHPSLGQKVRRLDVFKKVSSDFSEGTNIGGCISLCTFVAIMFFMYSEARMYLYPNYRSTLDPNNLFTREEMTISLDIEFPRFPCELLSLDIQDVMMSHHPNIASVKKYRIDESGQPLESGDFQIFRNNNPFEQMEMVKQALLKKHGCRLVGSFTVKEVPGNFHISSHAYEPNYVRALTQGMMGGIDVSHKINKLHFGSVDIESIMRQHPDAELMRLDQHSRIYPQGGSAFYTSHYHLSVVPTTYQHLLGSEKTYQYTWNHNSFPTTSMASLYFVYEIEGMSVHVVPVLSGLFSFLMNLCFIVGGVYAVAMFVDRMLHAICCKSTGYELIK